MQRGVAWARAHPTSVDALAALALIVLALASNSVGYDQGPPVPWIELPSPAVSTLLVLVAMGPVATRRRWPLASVLVGTTGLVLMRAMRVPDVELSSVTLFLLLLAAGRWGSPGRRDLVRWMVAVAVVISLASAILQDRRFVDEGMVSQRAYLLAVALSIVLNLVFLVAAWLLGDLGRRNAERTAELEATNAELLASRAEIERRAVIDERIRIARELHDVVAHHVSVMGVQAGAARRIIEIDPAAASAAVTEIEQTSRQAVDELHHLLGFLRNEPAASPDHHGPTHSEPPPHATVSGETVDRPAPRLDELDELRRQVAAAGLAVSLHVDRDDEVELPPSIELSAYRIIQEALTNTLRHSGCQQARVELTTGRDGVRITVADQGRGPQGSSAGRGLTGMRERVALHGGRIELGSGPTGGFVVDAWLPLRAEARR